MHSILCKKEGGVVAETVQLLIVAKADASLQDMVVLRVSSVSPNEAPS